MASALQIRRGPKANLAAAVVALGEPLIVTDTRELYIGTGVGGTGKYKVGDIVFAAVAPPVELEKVWIDTATDTIHRAADDGLSWIAVSGGGGSGLVTTDFTVYGVTQGIYANGNVIAAGTSLETVVKNMLQAIIPPTYSTPTLAIAGSGVQQVEIGTTITPTITPGFTQRDGGALTLYTLRKNGADMVVNPTAIAFSDVAFVLGATPATYQATAQYDAGPVKNNNQGTPTPAGQITAGTATSNSVTYTGGRLLFFGMDGGSAAPATSADVRFLTGKTLNPANGSTFTLNIPAGTARIVIAYPATLRDLTSVKYVELGNGEVKDTFVLSSVNVEGADGFAAIGYKIYSYVPAVPFGDAVTYAVTI